jgi:hypothetical protein
MVPKIEEQSFWLVGQQGDQMSFLKKVAQNVGQPILEIFFLNSLKSEESCKDIWSTSRLFIKLNLKSVNQMGKNSANLVTLLAKYFFGLPCLD